MSQCPKCKSEIGNNIYCGCGWKEAKKSGVQANPLGYIQCEWNNDGERCRYPGTMSRSTGPGSWLCRLHWQCESAFEGAAIVQASVDYRHQTNADRAKIHQAEADKKCSELGLKTIAEKRASVLENAGKLADKWRPRQRVPGDDDEEIAA